MIRWPTSFFATYIAFLPTMMREGRMNPLRNALKNLLKDQPRRPDPSLRYWRSGVKRLVLSLHLRWYIKSCLRGVSVCMYGFIFNNWGVKGLLTRPERGVRWRVGVRSTASAEWPRQARIIFSRRCIVPIVCWVDPLCWVVSISVAYFSKAFSLLMLLHGSNENIKRSHRQRT